MSDPRYRDDTAVEQRDRAHRRLGTLTAGALAGGLTVTVLTAGLAYAYAPGRDSSSSSASTSPSSSDPSTVPATDGGGTAGLQPSSQLPSFGGFGGRGHAVSGGS